MNYICKKCGKVESVFTQREKCTCGGLWSLDFRPPKFDESLIDKTEWSIFRYRAFMPLIDESRCSISLGEGMTPIVPYDGHLLLKMDYFMPTLSFKDRGAAVLMAHCKAIGVKSVVQDSSGNAGNSVAAYAAKGGIGCDIYVPGGTSPNKIAMINAHGATVHVVEGTRDHCADVCRAQVTASGKYYANHVYNPFFYEGTKTYIYEVYEQLKRIPQTVFLPVGNGTLFIGAVKALEHLLESGVIDKMPKIVAIQGENCAPIAAAARVKSPVPLDVAAKPTIAEGIAIGKPMRGEEILGYIYRHNIDIVEAPEDKILSARSKLAKRGIYVEHTTAANLAAYERYCELHGQVDEALIPMCGAGLKSDH